jgi:hypothetical protein
VCNHCSGGFLACGFGGDVNCCGCISCQLFSKQKSSAFSSKFRGMVVPRAIRAKDRMNYSSPKTSTSQLRY